MPSLQIELIVAMSIHRQVTPMILTLTGWHAPPAPMRLHNGISSPFRTRADDDHVLNQGSTSHPTLSQNQDLIGELSDVEPLHLSRRRHLVGAIVNKLPGTYAWFSASSENLLGDTLDLRADDIATPPAAACDLVLGRPRSARYRCCD
jgi:hypothetical protein